MRHSFVQYMVKYVDIASVLWFRLYSVTNINQTSFTVAIVNQRLKYKYAVNNI